VEPDAAANAVKLLLEALGVDEGEHTANTPERVAKAFKEQLWGYNEDPRDYLRTTFPAPADPGLVVQAGIDIQSTCAHHLLPILGHATVAYRPSPGQRIVGLSKLTRVAYAYAARLQVQERLGQQVVQCINQVLNPRYAVCIITAAHDCMRLRGVRSPASVTTTIATVSPSGSLRADDLALIQQLHLQQAR
jgi:GTP cyclohydrolase I